jgi:hypothetical protein
MKPALRLAARLRAWVRALAPRDALAPSRASWGASLWRRSARLASEA